MNRRSFLNFLSTAAGLATIDPERLLWTATKTIFVPSPIVMRTRLPEVQWRSIYPQGSLAGLTPQEISAREMVLLLREAELLIHAAGGHYRPMLNAMPS